MPPEILELIEQGALQAPALLEEYHLMEVKTGYTMHMNRIPIKELVV